MTTNVRALVCCSLLALAMCGIAMAQSGEKVERLPMANPDLPIAGGVVVPAGYDTVYVSGHIPKVANANASQASTEMYGDTKTQTISALQQISDLLAAQQLTMADVVMVHVFLVGDPANGGKMDFAAMNAGFVQFFRRRTMGRSPSRSSRPTQLPVPKKPTSFAS